MNHPQHRISRVIPRVMLYQRYVHHFSPLYDFIPLHRFSFMVISHSMDVFVPMVMSSFMALSASINSKHDCTDSPSIHILSSKTLRHFCQENLCFFVCVLCCFLLRACLAQLAVQNCWQKLWLPSSAPLSSSLWAKTIPDLGHSPHSPQLCYRISFIEIL